MNWFTKLFKPKSIDQSNSDLIDAYNAYIAGEKLWKESILSDESEPLELRKNKALEALKLFDKAIEKGYVEEAQLYSMRGSILNDLGFFFEALEDYNSAIERDPKKGVANTYFARSLIKDSIFDFEGSLADIKEAIRISKLDNDDNREQNSIALKNLKFNTATDFYEFFSLPNAERRIELQKKLRTDRSVELKNIKRR